MAEPAAPLPPPDDAARLDALWTRWRVHGEVEARQALFEEHLPWVRMVARDVFLRVRLRTVEWADYVHLASVGLLESIDRYQPERGVPFTAFARLRVRGAVFNGLHEFREHSGAPRRDERYAERTADLADESGDGELDDVIAATIGLAFGYLLEQQSLSGDDAQACAGYRSVEAEDIEKLLKRAVETLPERERFIVRAHYFQQLSFTEIAGVLKVTKGRVSQLHSQALRRIKQDYERHHPA